jgi:tRNA-specific 2-thiouridylase
MKMSKKTHIIVAMSGGVDSSVAALLLKQQKYDIAGIYMHNWDSDNDDPYCKATQDMQDAKAVCEKLHIPFKVVNFAQEYWDKVFQYFLNELANGRTPNPDVFCNQEIKFKAFLDYAQSIGADVIATGHYARISNQQEKFSLIKAKDQNKDQSYFLYRLQQYQLNKAIFPIGELNKVQVRKIAKDAGLINYAKKDSTGICFIGERKFKNFLKEYLLAQPGNIETEEGKVIGKHEGLMFYTLGQRKGIGIGGMKDSTSSPWFVIGKDIKRKVLIVGQGENHPQLFSQYLHFNQTTWINGDLLNFPLSCTAKTRYRQPDQACRLYKLYKGKFSVEFAQPQRAITPGQSVVFYQGVICLGGGIIQ